MRFFVCFFFEIFLELELSPLFSPREFFFLSEESTSDLEQVF